MFDSIQDFVSIENEKEKLEAYIKAAYRFFGYGLWGLLDKKTGSFVGECGIQVRDVDGEPYYELEYAIRKEFQGLGYAREAAQFVLDYVRDVLEGKEMISIINHNNTKSIRFIEKLGFAYWKPYSEQEGIYIYFYK